MSFGPDVFVIIIQHHNLDDSPDLFISLHVFIVQGLFRAIPTRT
jgi:hypothetical protein